MVTTTQSGRIIKSPVKTVMEIPLDNYNSDEDSDYHTESESDFDSDDESYVDSDSDSD